ncbi:SLC26A/SulP transporter family protein [Shimia sp. R11_0]|uniref:SulP family inorganic anion transporter n=1 Tax=Shimia sp. R11_0 TaxID=2821096 RepID=UPI001AD9BB9A|nr:SulP family inorganic anion transporter [Shimia sp. R11_0]MBO9479571.1 SLC26A/SulP transporter family protein [Shimia sp. R11_0]
MTSPVQLCISVFFTALVAAAFSISFATIVYRGDLAVFLTQGIGLALLGTVTIGLVGAVSLSFRGSILGPQDVPAILLASGAAAIMAESSVAPDALYATIACLIAITSITTGVMGVIMGKLRLAHVTRFFPYPVLAGFLATTGLFLLRGGLELTLGDAYSGHPVEFLLSENAQRWLVAFVFAVVICVTTRVVSRSFVLPVMLTLTLVGLYGFYATQGHDLHTLRAAGLLLGPFQSGGFYGSVEPALVFQADWGVILANAPLILTVALSALIGMTLNASGLELELNRDFDLNQEARGAGLANILSGVVGGIPGYHFVGQTMLANRLGLQGALAGISAAGGCALLFLFGGALLNALPIAFFASVIAYLGLDLLYCWLWVERKRLGRMDYAIVLAIPFSALAFGFLSAIALGLLLCAAIFIFEYSRLSIVRAERDLSMRRSRVERPSSELMTLERARGTTKILELNNFIFFVTSQALRARVKTLHAGGNALRWIVLDFKNVTGFDVSARHILDRIQEDCDQAGVTLLLSGLDPQRHTGSTADKCRSLDVILAEIEDIVLREAAATNSDKSADTDIALFFKLPEVARRTHTQRFHPGETVMSETSQSRDVYLLVSGRLSVVSSRAQADAVVLATILPGAAVGEMAYYTKQPRSAAIIAESASELICLRSAEIDELAHTDPEIAAQFHRLVAQNLALRLSRSNAQLLALEH